MVIDVVQVIKPNSNPAELVYSATVRDPLIVGYGQTADASVQALTELLRKIAADVQITLCLQQVTGSLRQSSAQPNEANIAKSHEVDPPDAVA